MDMQERPRVLLLGDDALRLAPLRQTLSRSARVGSAEDLPHALSLLARGAFDVVFCDERFYCGTWREALERIAAIYPELPVIVVSRASDPEAGEWAEVVAAGAFDLLPSVRNEPATLALLEHAVASGEGRALRSRA
jgi:DNA-binding NtrC family response regulator